MELARLKAQAVAGPTDGDALVVGCDSVLELDGEVHGKPGTAEVATARWRAMRGRSGVLHTGHACHRHGRPGDAWSRPDTVVRFADLDEDEIAAYVATGEPLQVAGAFTIDGLGGAYVTGIEGDPHTVVGIGLPLLREMMGDLGAAVAHAVGGSLRAHSTGRPRPRAMSIRWTSEVPSPISRILASR